MAAGILRQFSGLFNDLGRLVGYRNPVSQQDEGGFPQILCNYAVPFVLPSSGSMGNNGALTVTTALPFTIFPQTAFVYLPANAIASGSAAGWYFASFSSTTAATVYNSPYQGGDPLAAMNAIPFVTTGPGAYTQTTSATADIVGPTCAVPGGAMGLHGSLELDMLLTVPNNANGKPLSIRADSTVVSTTSGLASVGGKRYLWFVQNRGNASRQLAQSGTGVLASGNAGIYAAVDTSTLKSWGVAMEIATATDYIIVERFQARLHPSAA